MSQISTVDCGYLAIVQATADQIWQDPIANKDYVATADAAIAVIENQTGTFTEMTGAKDKDISVEWLSTCNVVSSACADECNPSAVALKPQCTNYSMDLCQTASFYLSSKDYRTRTIDMQVAVAKGILAAKKELDEYLAAQVVTGLVSNAGTNLYTGGIGTVSAGSTCIPSAYWDASMFGYFALVSKMNKFSNPYLLTGTNLFNAVWSANNGGNPGAAQMLGTMPIYFDPFNVESVASGSTFMLHKSAAALVTKAYYPEGAANSISKGGSYLLWSEPSMNLPGVMYDIVYQSECTGNDWVDTYSVSTKAGFFINNTGCTATTTGILQFECSTACV